MSLENQNTVFHVWQSQAYQATSYGRPKIRFPVFYQVKIGKKNEKLKIPWNFHFLWDHFFSFFRFFTDFDLVKNRPSKKFRFFTDFVGKKS